MDKNLLNDFENLIYSEISSNFVNVGREIYKAERIVKTIRDTDSYILEKGKLKKSYMVLPDSIFKTIGIYQFNGTNYYKTEKEFYIPMRDAKEIAYQKQAFFPPKQIVVIASKINLREFPSTNAKILDKISKDAILNADSIWFNKEENTDWYRVSYFDEKGFVSAEYAKPKEEVKPVLPTTPPPATPIPTNDKDKEKLTKMLIAGGIGVLGLVLLITLTRR